MSWMRVYQLVKQIPRGRVLTYGAVARILRIPGGARAAGHAMAATPSGKGIPWHRVLGARGKLLIREPYASLQRKLLETEGVTIVPRGPGAAPLGAAERQKEPRQKFRERKEPSRA